MKKSDIRFSFLLAILFGLNLFFFGCGKEDLREPYVGLIDPSEEPDRLSRHLGIQGSITEGDLPEFSNINNITITNAQNSAKVSKGSKLYIPFTYNSEQEIAGIYLQVIGAEHYWKIPAEEVPNGNSYVFAVQLPDRVLEGNFNLKFAFYDEDDNVSAPTHMNTIIANIEKVCNGNSRYHEEGSEGLTVRRMELNDIAGTVNIEYYMYSLPDRLDIWYDGAWVATTDEQVLNSNDAPPSSVCYDGTDGYVSLGGVLSFEYDPNRNKEFFIYMYGCFGETAWDFWVDCPEDQSDPCMEDIPSASIFTADETFSFSLSSTEPQITNLQVQRGDYVFFSAKGTGSIGSNILGIQVDVTPEGDLFVLGEDVKRWSEYHPGQLIVSLNNKKYPSENYNLKREDCIALPDEYFLDYGAFSGEYGNYFIAESSGQLSFELNDNNLSDNLGNFEIEIFKLSKAQHQYRNCFNRCSKKEPIMQDDYLARDSLNFLWKEKENNGPWTPEFGETYVDELLELCWHGNYEDYRGLDTQVAGCQCIYDSDGKLVNTPSSIVGSYDYGYRDNPEDRRLHFILDVFPHVAYLLNDPGFIYTSTPEENLY